MQSGTSDRIGVFALYGSLVLLTLLFVARDLSPTGGPQTVEGEKHEALDYGPFGPVSGAIV